MRKQYNPFHFVPAVRESGWDASSDLKKLPPHVGHDRYVPGTVSGTLTCRLTTITAIVIGSDQSRLPRQVAQVNPLPSDGRPFIPGSTLRGMLSAILEAATGSALRILDQKPYEVRVPVGRLSERRTVLTKTGQPATAWDFFAAIDPELVPLHPGRRRLSLAELILGVVSENPESNDTRQSGTALASRVRISDALPVSTGNLLAPAVTLRILSSPKPSQVEAPSSPFDEPASPCPVLYLKPATGPSAYIPKESLQPGAHIPQGRKFYLHQTLAPNTQPWRTSPTREAENADQKNSVQPILADKEFTFTVHFDNLAPLELAVLLYALKPTDAFRHKLGMGRPLGLGSIEIAITGQQEINRLRRYRLEGLLKIRSNPVSWFPSMRDKIVANVPPAVHEAIRALGEQAPPASEVHYPLGSNQIDIEDQTFKFFVENQRAARPQWLRPISENKGKLPPLE